MMRSILRGALAGGLGTFALSATTYLDMAVRGRPASKLPERVVDRLTGTGSVSLGTQPEATHRDVFARHWAGKKVVLIEDQGGPVDTTTGSSSSLFNFPAMRNTQKAAAVVGIVFFAVGLLGFVPGITTNYGDMQFAGHESKAELLGIFQVSILHNVVHLLFGVVGLAMARSFGGARAFLLVGGLIYLVLWLYGLAIDHDSDANFVPVNMADNWLHLGLGAGMVALAALVPRTERRPKATPPRR